MADYIEFTKMHGIGNDYLYINCLACTPPRLPDLARVMSERHTGVGADGIILIVPSDIADFGMRIFNADGSEARMCGNGSRCVAKYLYDNGITDRTDLTLETLSGVKHLYLTIGGDGLVGQVTVDMGPAMVYDRMTVLGHELIPVDVGNPHAVLFSDTAPDTIDVMHIGPQLECADCWQDRANIEFVRCTGPEELHIRVWERGSGETMACGTGACAAVAAAVARGMMHSDTEVVVHLPGGDLRISHRSCDGHMLMTGPAVTICVGKFFTNTLN